MTKRTKVDERREQEEYERQHPWRPMTDDPPDDGTVVHLLFGDMAGANSMGNVGWILAWSARGRPVWLCVDRPKQMTPKAPMNWRPTNRKLGPAKRDEIKRQNRNQLDW